MLYKVSKLLVQYSDNLIIVSLLQSVDQFVILKRNANVNITLAAFSDKLILCHGLPLSQF